VIPKEKFLIDLIKIIKIFEKETGVEVHSINMDRLNVKTNQDISAKTIIQNIDLKLK